MNEPTLPTEIRLSWSGIDNAPPTVLSVRCVRPLTSRELRRVADVVARIEVMREVVQVASTRANHE
jgi:hypothetical protein